MNIKHTVSEIFWPPPLPIRSSRQYASDKSRQEAGLPAEPPADEPGVVRLALRFPDGSRKNRCFRGTDTLQVLARERGPHALEGARSREGDTLA